MIKTTCVIPVSLVQEESAPENYLFLMGMIHWEEKKVEVAIFLM